MNPLYIIPTPIGNLEDITVRSLNILKNSDLVLCEDTRRTSKLLNHYSIRISRNLSCYNCMKSNFIAKNIILNTNKYIIPKTDNIHINKLGFSSGVRSSERTSL